MPWVVDTCVVLDVLIADPRFGKSSAECLEARRGEGLIVCPMTFVELSPAFHGNLDLEREFFSRADIDWQVGWAFVDTLAAHAAWHRYVQSRPARRVPKRPLADILIGAFAQRFQGLITRNPQDFRSYLPELTLLVPLRH